MNLVPFAYVWEIASTVDFLETDEFYDVKVGTYSQINEYMSIYDYQGQCHSQTFIQAHSDSTFSNIFSQKNL